MGQCHEIFHFWFFSWISFPQAPEYTITAVDTGGKFAACVVDTGGNFAASVVDTGGKFATSVIDLRISPKFRKNLKRS